MLILQHITYAHPNKDLLFEDISLSVGSQDKIALVGNNGTGKSTLLKLMAGRLQPLSGTITAMGQPYYVPQLLGQYDDHTIAQALGISEKLEALHAILSGNTDEQYFTLLHDDWTIEERCAEAFQYWQLHIPDLSVKMGTLSGGQKTKILLAGIQIHEPAIVLLDEPGNHLDAGGRALLYDYIREARHALVVVSHDRALLNLLPALYELHEKGITLYGGNYDFYAQQKAIAQHALQEELKQAEKALRKAKETERETMERQQKLDARGRKKQEKAGLPTISLNTFRNNAEKSTARIKDTHAAKTAGLSEELEQLRKNAPGNDKMKLDFAAAALHKGKILVAAKKINYNYGDRSLWPMPLSFTITSGSRIAVKGANGSGKTTLVKIILGSLEPTTGHMERAAAQHVYIDQDYSLIDQQLTVYEQVQRYNTAHLQEHELKSRLTHFLFTKNSWDKHCSVLSGGEKMRLLLCCLTVSNQAPDMIILDEPTNNLDLQNISILTNAVTDYKGTLIVISHDAVFLEEVGVQEEIVL